MGASRAAGWLRHGRATGRDPGTVQATAGYPAGRMHRPVPPSQPANQQPERVQRGSGGAPRPLAPGSTIGILGGGQLGRMLGCAARALGYRLVVLDPDPLCPAAAVADDLIVGGYDDADAALALAAASDVVTYELEHVSAEVVAAVAERLPVRPGLAALRATQDRLAERRVLAEVGAAAAPWREVRDLGSLEAGGAALGYPLRLKAAIGGYDGRSQARVGGPADLAPALEALGGRSTAPPAASPPTAARVPAFLLERELEFACELSVVCARDLAGRTVPFPVARNRHDEGILVESVAPAPPPVTTAVAREAQALAARLADALDVVGLLTVELFLLPDGSLVVNELAPRVHNSGHWTIEACRTSQFEQHVRAICGLSLGSPDLLVPAAMVNLLGSGPLRESRLLGLDAALADPNVHVHVYDKRRVFERRKMGHVTALALPGEGTPEALDRAEAALSRLRWA